jgi:hypothetical protein
MNIGIDIDGTLTKYPDFFVELGRIWRKAGHKVYIITGLGIDGVYRRMEKYPYLREGHGDFYDDLVCTASYNSEEVALIGIEPDNEKIVGRFKQRKCKELEICIMFDDKALVHRQFGNTPVFEVA